MPEWQHAMPPPGAIPGAPHILAIVIWGILLVFARSRFRPNDDAHARLVTWAFAIGLARDVMLLAIPLTRQGSPIGQPPFPAFPVFETWLAQTCAVILVGAFLRYLSKQEEPAGLYLRVSLPAIAICSLIAGIAFGPVALPNPPPLDFRLPLLESGVGLIALGSGLWLTFRHIHGSFRGPMLCGIALFALRDIVKAVSPMLIDSLGGPPDIELRALATELGVLCFGYIFIREHSAKVQADFEQLEHRVQDRNTELQEALTQLSEANRQLREQTTIDPLTRIGNRRFFDEALSVEWARSVREDSPLAIAIIDLDRFKRINDSYGHPVGDSCLVRVAEALCAATRRASDVVARYGGDEFIVLLPATDASGAERVLENVRTHVDVANFTGEETPDITISIGIASCLPRGSGSPTELIQSADAGLYNAKRAGRNQIASSEPTIA